GLRAGLSSARLSIVPPALARAKHTPGQSDGVDLAADACLSPELSPSRDVRRVSSALSPSLAAVS
ncbi:MAG TPA: hypothetical protein VK157_15840, partial [Phycisphaerales bacterium]|nr:hypothetical protein [Phycisphaerales bacterium]